MNIQKTNSSPAFGMAFKIQGYKGAKALAQKLHGYSDPNVAEKYFVKDVVKPLENVKSDVIYDGRDVIVIDGVTKDKYKVLYHGNFDFSKDGSSRIYSVQQNGKESTLDVSGLCDESYKPFEESEFTAGVRIATYLDNLRKSATESVEETAGRLYSLFKD